MQENASGPSIQAVDDPEGTIYILRRPGKQDISAHWPQPLLKLEPNAVRIACYMGNEYQN